MHCASVAPDSIRRAKRIKNTHAISRAAADGRRTGREPAGRVQTAAILLGAALAVALAAHLRPAAARAARRPPSWRDHPPVVPRRDSARGPGAGSGTDRPPAPTLPDLRRVPLSAVHGLAWRGRQDVRRQCPAACSPPRNAPGRRRDVILDAVPQRTIRSGARRARTERRGARPGLFAGPLHSPRDARAAAVQAQRRSRGCGTPRDGAGADEWKV